MKDAILSHYGFSRLPFGKDLLPEEIFPTASGSDASAMLELGLDTEDIMVISGPVGCGKSLVLRIATSRFDSNRYQLIYLRGNISKPSELFKLILQGMKIDPPYSITKVKPVFYNAVAEATRKPVIVLDDAQDTAPEVLLMLKSMTNFEADSSNRITFILAGQSELSTILSYAHFESLRTRIRLYHQLTGMSLEETAGYIDHRLKIVHREEKLFSDAAKSEIFKQSNGIPRKINSLCYLAIVRGAIRKKQILDTLDIPQDEG